MYMYMYVYVFMYVYLVIVCLPPVESKFHEKGRNFNRYFCLFYSLLDPFGTWNSTWHIADIQEMLVY